MPEPGDLRAETTDHVFDTKDKRGQMPDKVRGKHRWIVLATYTTSREQLLASSRGEQAHLDQENLVSLQAGCLDCEQPWPSPEPCRAEGFLWNG